MRKILHFFWLMVALSLAACGGGGGSPGANPNQPTLVTTAGTSQVIPVGASRDFDISGGVPPYRVGAADAAIAVAVVNGKKLTIGGAAAGTATVSVLDFKGDKVDIAVRVGSSIPLYTTAPTSLTVGVGPAASRTFLIGGGGAPYTVQGSDGNVALVQMVGADRWTVTGVAIGSTTVKIRDAAGTEVSVSVTVGSPELRISPTDLTIPVGVPAMAKISGGQPPYIVAGGIPAAITAEIKNGDELHITGNLVAELDLSVADATGKTVKVAVKITTDTTQIRLSPNALVISEVDDQPLVFGVFGAVGPYCVFSSSPALLQVVGNPCTTDNAFLIDTGTRGSRCVAQDTDVKITILDSARSIGESVVTIRNNGTGCGNTGFAVVPSALALGEGTTNTAAVVGGSGSYATSSSNSAVATATVAGDLLTVTGTGAGSATITVVDLADPRISTTVAVTVTPKPVTAP